MCQMSCPQILDAPCAKGPAHSIIVRDAGVVEFIFIPGLSCNKGGGYELSVLVRDAEGKVVPEKKLKFGGGPNRKVPKWAVTSPKNLAPVLDDENVPLFGTTRKIFP